VNAVVVAIVVMVCTFGGTCVGMWLQPRLPRHHLDADSRDIIKLATGLIATVSALVLGLVIATAKGTFDKVDSALEDSSADILTLDRVLARYGPETAPIRDAIRNAVATRIDEIWRNSGSLGDIDSSSVVTKRAEVIMDRIGALVPASDVQREMKAEAMQLGSGILRARWLVQERGTSAVEAPFLVVLVCWLTLIFTSFGLFAPRHATTIWALALCALSISAAVFLILEMDGPFDGLMKVSPAPLRYVLAHLGQ
jgi:hypothetical protein